LSFSSVSNIVLNSCSSSRFRLFTGTRCIVTVEMPASGKSVMLGAIL
jgi:hypothetical protein